MDAIREIIPLVLAGSLFALVLAVGLDAQLDDLLSLFARPGRLLKAILAVNVIVPVAAGLLVALIPISFPAKAAILLMAISPVPPLAPGKELKVSGEKSYSYGLYAALILLATVIVPVSAAVLQAVYQHDISLAPLAVARSVALHVLLPLALGLAVRRIAPSLTARAPKVLRTIAMVLLAVAVVPVLLRVWPAFAPLIGDGTVAVMVLVVLVALLGGHLLGGPDINDRAALAVTAATRHPGIALMIVHANANDPRVSAAVMGFMIIGLIAAAPYQIAMKRRVAAASA